jgi:Peptidase family M28/PDZ domain/PA domain
LESMRRIGSPQPAARLLDVDTATAGQSADSWSRVVAERGVRMRWFGILLVLLSWQGAFAGEVEKAAAIDRLKADVTFLAADEQEGRGPGTTGLDRAADHIAKAFAEAGLQPAPGAEGYFQPFTLIGNPKLGAKQDLDLVTKAEEIDAELRANFMPLSLGAGGDFDQKPVVFAGYGISAKDKATGLEYDDYAGIDAKGKLVLVLRRAPGSDVVGAPFGPKDGQPSHFATFQHKVTNAFAHDAAGVLLVNDLAGLKGEDDELLLFTSAGVERLTQIPVIMAKRDLVDRALKAAGMPSLEDLERAITADPKSPKPASRDLADLKASGKIAIDQEVIHTKNVIGVLEGKGPDADETIVVGAHYDHLGRGDRGSLAPLSSEIHNGADDNASGTALIMELARRLAGRADPLGRRVVFIAFSGEERGLKGSQHYVDNPLFPLAQTAMMFNFDMVGRLNDEDTLTVFGVDSTPGLRELVEKLGPEYDLKIRPNADPTDNSDHASFHRKGIPVCFPFTGTHRDYHRPSDDTHLINFDGMSRVADFSEDLITDFANRDDRPEFVAADIKQQDPRPVMNVRVSMGTIPDYDESVKGVRINGTRPGSSAEQAGMKAGDVIIGFGGSPVGTIYDYMEGLAKYKPGDEVDVKVERDGKEIVLKAKLQGTAPRINSASPH